jgi:sugar/nucleoside kinase (ribokinase family)
VEKQEEITSVSTQFIAAGEIFMDLVFVGLDAPVEDGTESFAKDMLMAPGGIANVAVAMARLGVSPKVVAGLGKDVFGNWIAETLKREGVDLSLTTEIPKSSVTTSIASGMDRAMVTYSGEAEQKKVLEIGKDSAIVLDLGSQVGKADWWREAASRGAQVYADVRWEGTKEWKNRTLSDLEHCSVFTPNAKEAMFLSGADTVEEAAEFLSEKTECVVVTADSLGSYVIDSRTNQKFWTAAIEVEAKDATGAGDVFLASLAVADQSGLPIQNSVRFASVCSALSVTKFSGSLGAPKLSDVLSWHESNFESSESEDAADYEFLPEFVRSLILGSAASPDGQQGSEGSDK